MYALADQQDSEASPDVVVGILSIFSNDVYALIDPGATLSYVTPFIAKKLEVRPELLHEQFVVSTPVGESVLVC